MILELTALEIRVAAIVGVERQLVHTFEGTRDAYGYRGEGWNLHIDGAIAEYVVAKALGRFWQPVVPDHRVLEGDVGRLQVRSTRHKRGALLLHPEDPDRAGFVLVIAEPPRYTVAGWCYAYEGKAERYWRANIERPAFFAPQGILRDVLQVEPPE